MILFAVSMLASNWIVMKGLSSLAKLALAEK